MVKYAQRLDDARLAEVLNQRGMADLDAIRDLLHIAQGGGMGFAEALVTTNLVADWDLSRVAAEIFQLPFLPVGIVKPDEKLWAELDQAFLTKNGLVPVSRFGQVMTVAMPGLVPAEVLGLLSVQTDLVVLPVVGTVETNRRWLLEHRGGTKPGATATDSDWSALFDEGEQAVRDSLDGKDEDEDASLAAGLDSLSAIAQETEEEAEPDLEAQLQALGNLEFTESDDGPAAAEASSAGSSDGEAYTIGSLELPPPPKFG